MGISPCLWNQSLGFVAQVTKNTVGGTRVTRSPAFNVFIITYFELCIQMTKGPLTFSSSATYAVMQRCRYKTSNCRTICHGALVWAKWWIFVANPTGLPTAFCAVSVLSDLDRCEYCRPAVSPNADRGCLTGVRVCAISSVRSVAFLSPLTTCPPPQNSLRMGGKNIVTRGIAAFTSSWVYCKYKLWWRSTK